jgi:hypothetical protein
VSLYHEAEGHIAQLTALKKVYKIWPSPEVADADVDRRLTGFPHPFRSLRVVRV